MIEGAESARQFNGFTPRQQQRALAVLQRTGNYRTRANPGADVRIGKNVFAIRRALAKIFHHIQDNADCFLGVLSIRYWKSKKGDHAFPGSGLEVSAFVREMLSGPANKLCRRFGEGRRLRIFRGSKFVADIADYDAYFVSFRLRIERNSPVIKAAKFFIRQAIAKECSHQMRAVSPQKSRPAFRNGQCECQCKNGGNRLEKYPVERADPRQAK